MKIDITELSSAVNKGLTINEYIALLSAYDGFSYIFPSGYFVSDLIQLRLNDYILANFEISGKGKALIEEIQGMKEVSSKVDNKYEILHKKLQTILKEKTGTAKYKVEGKWAFLQNPTDLKEKIEKCVKRYKLTDFDKIEKLLLNYTETACNKKFEKMQLLQYYILREKPEISSSLATDYSNYEEGGEEIKVKIEPKDIKNLF